MKIEKNVVKRLFYMVLLSATMIACKDDDDLNPDLSSELVTASGNVISPDGIWESGCATDMEMNLSEIFTFSGESIIIDIRIFQDDQCNDQIGTEKIDINYRVGETFQAQLNGQSVLANKISGTATESEGESEDFRQSFYIDDSGSTLKLHHGRFGNDGGQLTDDGYPLELIPIAISKR